MWPWSHSAPGIDRVLQACDEHLSIYLRQHLSYKHTKAYNTSEHWVTQALLGTHHRQTLQQLSLSHSGHEYALACHMLATGKPQWAPLDLHVLDSTCQAASCSLPGGAACRGDLALCCCAPAARVAAARLDAAHIGAGAVAQACQVGRVHVEIGGTTLGVHASVQALQDGRWQRCVGTRASCHSARAPQLSCCHHALASSGNKGRGLGHDHDALGSGCSQQQSRRDGLLTGDWCWPSTQPTAGSRLLQDNCPDNCQELGSSARCVTCFQAAHCCRQWQGSPCRRAT